MKDETRVSIIAIAVIGFVAGIVIVSAIPVFEVGSPNFGTEYWITGEVQNVSITTNGCLTFYNSNYHEQAFISVNNTTFYVDGWESWGNGMNVGYCGLDVWQNVTELHNGSIVKIGYHPWSSYYPEVQTLEILK